MTYVSDRTVQNEDAEVERSSFSFQKQVERNYVLSNTLLSSSLPSFPLVLNSP